MKYPDYVMMNMASGMTLDDLEGENPKRYFIDSSSTKATNIFTYQQSIGIFVKNRQKIFGKMGDTHQY